MTDEELIEAGWQKIKAADALRQTAEEAQRIEVVEGYVLGLPWGPETGEHARTLVVANIREFFAWLHRQGYVKLPPLR